MNLVSKISTCLRYAALYAATGLTLSGCALFGSSDVNSSNPVIAGQAQRIEDLERQISEQKRTVNTEEAKLKSLKYQLKSAEQELKARKM